MEKSKGQRLRLRRPPTERSAFKLQTTTHVALLDDSSLSKVFHQLNDFAADQMVVDHVGLAGLKDSTRTGTEQPNWPL